MSSLQTLPPEVLEAIAGASVTTSFVVDSFGSSVNRDGNSKGLGNETDLELLRTLRANSEVVLTSGLTARAENYRMPRHADLAIFTAQGVQSLDLKPRAGQQLQILSPPLVNSYQEALSAIQKRYKSVHIEFGTRGAVALRQSIDLFVISGKEQLGVELFTKELELVTKATFVVPGLFITLGLGRG